MSTHPAAEPATDPAVYWETFYDTGQARWSGRPNASLVAEVEGLVPGTALDLGCGQGGDAIWLAEQGWTVTGTDIAASALAVAARHAAAAGVADAITWERHDLAVSRPAGPFDLVFAAFLHAPVDLPRAAVLRAAAAAVAPGGTLLVVGHGPSHAHAHVDLPSPEEVVAELALPPAAWQLHTSELRTVEHAFRGEARSPRSDSVVRLQRTA